MFGSVSAWMINAVAGISPASDAVGFDKIIIKPELWYKLKWARGEYSSIQGKIVSDWKVIDRKFTLNVTIPQNCEALIYIPGKKIFESGMKLRNSKLLSQLKKEAGFTKIKVGGGNYIFNSVIGQ